MATNCIFIGAMETILVNGFFASFLSIFFSLYSWVHKKARRVNDSGQMDWGINKIK